MKFLLVFRLLAAEISCLEAGSNQVAHKKDLATLPAGQ